MSKFTFQELNDFTKTIEDQDALTDNLLSGYGFDLGKKVKEVDLSAISTSLQDQIIDCLQRINIVLESELYHRKISPNYISVNFKNLMDKLLGYNRACIEKINVSFIGSYPDAYKKALLLSLASLSVLYYGQSSASTTGSTRAMKAILISLGVIDSDFNLRKSVTYNIVARYVCGPSVVEALSKLYTASSEISTDPIFKLFYIKNSGALKRISEIENSPSVQEVMNFCEMINIGPALVCRRNPIAISDWDSFNKKADSLIMNTMFFTSDAAGLILEELTEDTLQSICVSLATSSVPHFSLIIGRISRKVSESEQGSPESIRDRAWVNRLAEDVARILSRVGFNFPNEYFKSLDFFVKPSDIEGFKEYMENLQVTADARKKSISEATEQEPAPAPVELKAVVVKDDSDSRIKSGRGLGGYSSVAFGRESKYDEKRRHDGFREHTEESDKPVEAMCNLKKDLQTKMIIDYLELLCLSKIDSLNQLIPQETRVIIGLSHFLQKLNAGDYLMDPNTRGFVRALVGFEKTCTTQGITAAEKMITHLKNSIRPYANDHSLKLTVSLVTGEG